MASSEYGTQGRSVPQPGVDGRGDQIGQVALEFEALRVLVVDRHPVHRHRLFAGRALDGHDDGVVSVQETADHGDERDDGGDRHVAVERTGAVEDRQTGRERSAHHQQREADLAGQVDHQGMGIDREQARLEMLDRFDQHHRVLAATDGDQEATGPGERGPAGRDGRGRPGPGPPGEGGRRDRWSPRTRGVPGRRDSGGIGAHRERGARPRPAPPEERRPCSSWSRRRYAGGAVRGQDRG